MGLKKYEIITVGGDKRIRALRSWQVGDRYVNIGDVGGIVYDEKTLSQDGACWLFRGNFGFPGARIGGDSIVDVGEAELSTTGTPNVDILGSSVVVGSKLQFASDQTAADAVVLTAADFEQGGFNYAAGVNWETMKATSDSYIRSKAPVFSGGGPVTVKCAVEGYAVTWYTTDSNGITTGASSSQIVTGAGVSFTVPAGRYFLIRLRKDPTGTIVPADATAAQIKFTGTYETKLSIIDSRVEINPASSTAVVTIKPGNTYTFAPGAKYPDSVIRNSKVVINGHATADRAVRLMSKFTGCNVAFDTTRGNLQSAGIYSNVKSLTASGILPTNVQGIIQATDCDNFAVSPTIFPRLAEALSANMPFIFQGCNVPGGQFYHHAQIANTYKNIDFALASVDLGKQVGSLAGRILVSSEIEGMYRIFAGTTSYGALVESYDSVKSLTLPDLTGSISATYGTTIYADAYLNGLFDIAGTNVFGNTMKHEASNTQDVSGVLVKGLFNATTNGSTISGVVANNARAVVAQPFRVSGAGGVSVSSPAGVECNIYLTDATNTILVNTGYVSGTNAPIAPALPAVYAYIAVKKANGSDILSMDEFKGVTVTVHNGCKIVNTGTTAVNMKGNIRVEDNATLVNASITGTGYFGGNSVTYYNPAVWASLDFKGTVYMKDNTLFAPSALTASVTVALLDMRDNAVFAGSLNNSAASYNITMTDEARCLGTINNSRSSTIMRGNSLISTAGIVAPECRGLLLMKDDARIESGNLVAVGYITLCGSYNQAAAKAWTGKRVIDSQDAPVYDNNVKTQYDF